MELAKKSIEDSYPYAYYYTVQKLACYHIPLLAFLVTGLRTRGGGGGWFLGGFLLTI
jgi:hypothetical protein